MRNLVELNNDMNISDVALFFHDEDTVDIHDSILKDVGPTEGQNSHF